MLVAFYRRASEGFVLLNNMETMKWKGVSDCEDDSKKFWFSEEQCVKPLLAALKSSILLHCLWHFSPSPGITADVNPIISMLVHANSD